MAFEHLHVYQLPEASYCRTTFAFTHARVCYAHLLAVCVCVSARVSTQVPMCVCLYAIVRVSACSIAGMHYRCIRVCMRIYV